MPGPFERIAELDRLVHEPARLAILTALSACRSADFLFLLRLTGLTKGNLSAHLTKLEQGGLVAIEKGYNGRTPTTQVSLTREGKSEIERHWKALEKLRLAALEWQPDPR